MVNLWLIFLLMLKLTTWSRVALRTVTTFNCNLDKQIEININELLTFVCLFSLRFFFDLCL